MLYPGVPMVRCVVSGALGTADPTLGAAVSGFLTMAGAGATNGRTYNYCIESNFTAGVPAKREIGRGAYTSATPSIARTTVIASTNGGAKESFGSDSEVSIVPFVDDLDWMVAQNSVAVALTDASTITTDWTSGINFTVTLGGNRTLGNPSNGVDGTWRSFQVTQDSNGTRTLAYGNQWKFPGGVVPVITTGNGAISRLMAYCRSSSLFELYASGLGLA